ncbi:hypothetical protein D3C84_1283590 [compost metagenome]
MARQYGLAQGLVGPQDMLLTYVLVEILRPHPGRQRAEVRRKIQRQVAHQPRSSSVVRAANR